MNGLIRRGEKGEKVCIYEKRNRSKKRFVYMRGEKKGSEGLHI